MKTAVETTIPHSLDASVSELFEKALCQGIFSGAVAGYISRRDKKKKEKRWAFGTTDQSRKKKVTFETFFDLASLTKPLVTVLSLMALMEEKGFDIYTPLKRLTGRPLPAAIADIQVGQLMDHSSGLIAYRPYYEELITREDQQDRKRRIWDLILTEKLQYPPGSDHVYSDLGYILLGAIIEEVSGLPLQVFWLDRIIKPLKLSKKFTLNENCLVKEKDHFAATERCPWSGEMLSGWVHDENCRAIGGVAGHAGLFGTVDGVMQLCDHLVQQFRGDEVHPAYSNERLRLILTRRNGSTWACGFDTPSKRGSSSGNYFSEQSVGHLGFTGTSFWMDLSEGISVVLLTNRVHPTRKNEGIKTFRPIFHDTIMRYLLKLGRLK